MSTDSPESLHSFYISHERLIAKSGVVVRLAPRLCAMIVVAVTLVLAGCAASPANDAKTPATSVPVPTESTRTSPSDTVALAQLDEVAASSADLGSAVTHVDCWTPSEHLVVISASEHVFRVICRVFYDQESAKRYKDMVCIGDFDKSPMLDSCYHWVYYSQMPRFEDGPALASPAPST